MTYDEWRESYFSGPLMNEAMARAAWDFAVLAEREACAHVAEWEPCITHTPQRIAAAIRARGQQ